MTKEETLNASHKEFVERRGVKSIYPEKFPAAHSEAALSAMSEYAKQQSMAFNNWVEVNYTGSHVAGYWNSESEKRFTTEQLYEIFMKHQS